MKKNKTIEWLFFVIILIGFISMLLPFIWMALSSLKTSTEFYESNWIPTQFMWENFTKLFTSRRINFGIYFINTVKVTGLTIIGSLLSCSLAAYALSVMDLPGENKIFVLVLLSMFLPPQVTMIPVFVIFKHIGWYNTHLPLYAPSFLGNAFGIFLMRQFFKSVPKELKEAATIDGCSHLGIFARIYLPLAKSCLITLGVITFQGKWGELMAPMIYLEDSKLYTLVVGIRQISDSQYIPKPNLEMAGNMLLVTPLIVIYILVQKYFTEGVSTSGLKG